MSSEIARIRQQIELESAAMRLAMYGFATVAKHEFISHRYNAIGKCQEKLRTLVGEEQASEIAVETYNHIMERDERDMHSSKGLTPPVPLHQLKTPPMIDEAKKTMRVHGCEIPARIIRDSRYLGHLLRNKSATRGTDGEGEPMPERRDEVMPEPGGSFELGGCLTSCVYDHDTSWR